MKSASSPALRAPLHTENELSGLTPPPSWLRGCKTLGARERFSRGTEKISLGVSCLWIEATRARKKEPDPISVCLMSSAALWRGSSDSAWRSFICQFGETPADTEERFLRACVEGALLEASLRSPGVQAPSCLGARSEPYWRYSQTEKEDASLPQPRFMKIASYGEFPGATPLLAALASSFCGFGTLKTFEQTSGSEQEFFSWLSRESRHFQNGLRQMILERDLLGALDPAAGSTEAAASRPVRRL